MSKAKSKVFEISKQVVWKAYQRVKANRGAAGVDRQSISAFEKNLKGNLYKIWNRMSSGCYFPPAVRLVEIPKADGKSRPLGIPTVSDRIAQTVARMYLEPIVEPKFHSDSYGGRSGKSALDAVGVARNRCWQTDWVIDMDISSFFDNLNHELVLKTVKHHTDIKWLYLYVERWLKAPVQKEDGVLVTRTKGSPQGSAISPLLANLFMHHAFDDWVRRKLPGIKFERYMDDVIIHCRSHHEAEKVLGMVRMRLRECELELHPDKTRIAYCKDSNRQGKYKHIQFDFLGYSFRPRSAKNREGVHFVSFLPAISKKSIGKIYAAVRDWHLVSRVNQSLDDIANLINPVIRGWINYYGRYYRAAVYPILDHINRRLLGWIQRKYKRFLGRPRRADRWLRGVQRRQPMLFAQWGFIPRPVTEQ